MLNYKGYIIKKEKSYFKVIPPEGKSWTEDTIKDAKEEIDKIEKEKGKQ